MVDGPGPTDAANNLSGIEAVVLGIAGRIDDVSRSVRDVILRDIASLGGDQSAIDILHRSVAANVETIVDLLHYGIDQPNFEVPAIAAEYARRLAQRYIPLDALVRAYRIGQTEFLRIAIDEIRATHTDAGAALLVAQQIMAITAEYIDWVTERVIQSYTEERDHWLIQHNTIRNRHLRRLLVGKCPHDGTVETAIGFPLGLRHIAVVSWTDENTEDPDSYGRVDRELRRITDFLPLNGQPLLVPGDQTNIWAWFPLFSKTTADQVTAALNTVADTSSNASFHAVGTIESGSHGFRLSHIRAQQVRKVMLAAKSGAPVRTFADRGMAVAALWGADVNLAKDWVAYVLGPLAHNDTEAARLRETLEVFLHSGSNYALAGESLHVHPNTIKYRITKAEEKLGGTTLEGRVDVSLALVLCHQLGDSVLVSDTE
jgi:sugar diacid utilization regulator